MEKYIIVSIKFRRYVGDHIKVINELEKQNPNYEFCQFISEYDVIMRFKNLRKEKLEKLENDKFHGE